MMWRIVTTRFRRTCDDDDDDDLPCLLQQTDDVRALFARVVARRTMTISYVLFYLFIQCCVHVVYTFFSLSLYIWKMVVLDGRKEEGNLVQHARDGATRDHGAAGRPDRRGRCVGVDGFLTSTVHHVRSDR